MAVPAEIKARRRVVDVDSVLLSEVEQWRKILAQNIVLRNPALAQQDLNVIVQGTLIRLLFLRICEDRGIEPYRRLEKMSAHCGQLYSSLCQLFQQAYSRYHSDIFDVRPATKTSSPLDFSSLTIDDQPFKEIIMRSYDSGCTYAFSVLSFDILGQVYEQFLGKVIHLREDHQIVIEEKPEIKKVGGIYYTPAHIVDYIVVHTVSPALKDKTPQQVSTLSILDPSCGAGSFLLRAYQYLLDWHRNWYVHAGPERHQKELYQTPDGDWCLTLSERQRILLNSIYGVDLDVQAVEVTKLSLLLKLLEDSSAHRANTRAFSRFRVVLPDLNRNIVCGDYLIVPNADQVAQISSDALQELVYHKTFNWQITYGEIMSRGGFDAIIGNPPYLSNEYQKKSVKQYLRSHFGLAKNQYDMYWLFIEQSLLLTMQRGRIAFIVPDAILARDEAKHTREMLLRAGLERVYHCGLVFDAKVSTAVFIIAKGDQTKEIRSDIWNGSEIVPEQTCRREHFLTDPMNRLLVHASERDMAILTRVEQASRRLGSFVRLSRGEEIGKKEVLVEGPIAVLAGDDIGRYSLRRPVRFLLNYKKKKQYYQAPKIVIVKTGERCIAALDTVGFVTMQSIYNVHLLSFEISYEALLGVLNSRFVNCYLYKTFTAYKHIFPQLNQTTIQSIPVPIAIVQEQALLIPLVRQMILLHERIGLAETEDEKVVLQRQIVAIEKQLDAQIYQFYELSSEEVKCFEEGVPERYLC
jgi:hypothetical protein